jgi:outer membrane protein OmpA-like peptidoglycan-associated protein/Mg-chelatase subunit ChlD
MLKKMTIKIVRLAFFALLFFNTFANVAVSQTSLDSAERAKRLLKEATVTTAKRGISLTIRNVDIGKFPEINIIVEAFNHYGEPLDTLLPSEVNVMENGKKKKVISVQKISIKERVPVDFVFLVDITGSMQKYIDATKNYITTFTTRLKRRGIDYRLGLILFSDIVEKVYPPTDNVLTFLGWLQPIRSYGGGDEKENALEALAEACEIKFRPAANKVLVIITDAPYHQSGEQGEGHTRYTTKSIIKKLNDNEIRVFSIVPPRLRGYQAISKATRGNYFDIDYPFSTILDNFSNQLTNLYAIRYRTDLPAIPDSIDIALLDKKNKQLVRKTIPIVELGRKLIIENLLYKTGSAQLPDTVQELNVLYQFMKNKPNVVILVEGHTDNVGSNRINDALSKRRAENVKRYLVKKGINPRRIKTIGYGERRPIASNATEWGRRLNRRTEIVIVAK